MRVAYICADHGVPVFGKKGCSIHVQEVIRALVKAHHDVTLFAARVGGEAPADLRNVTVCTLPGSDATNQEDRETDALQRNNRLYEILRSYEPYDFLYERYSLWSFGGIGYAQDRQIPSFLEVNAPLIEEQAQHRVLIHDEMARIVADKVFQEANALIAVSDEVASYIEKHLSIAQRDKVHVIPNGINPAKYTYRTQYAQTASNNWTIGFVGTLKPWHGVSTLIEAFDYVYKEDKAVRLKIIGDGPQKEQLLNDVRRKQLSDVVDFTGAVSPSEIPNMLNTLDVAVAPYPELDNFYFSPLKVYEYMAARLPVVVSELGQLKKLIKNEVNGLLTKPGDPQGFYQALMRLRGDPCLCERLGASARDTVVRHHTWDGVVRQILNIRKALSINNEVGV